MQAPIYEHERWGAVYGAPSCFRSRHYDVVKTIFSPDQDTPVPKPISSMSAKQIAQELVNFERYRTSKDAGKRKTFELNRWRFEELLSANEEVWGFRLDVSEHTIERAAKERRFLCYKDIADANSVDWNTAYRSINGHLWDLVVRSHARHEIMVSALIVNKTHLEDGAMEPETLAGFVKAAEGLGYIVKDPQEFLLERQEEAFIHFASH